MKIGLRPVVLLHSWILIALALPGQAVTHFYVEPPAKPEPSLVKLHEELVRQLKARKDIVLVGKPEEADNSLSISGETHIKGYVGTNIRLRYLNSESQPVYGGYLSVELDDKQGQPLWSYLVTPRRFGPEDINRNLAEQAVKKVLEYLANPGAHP